MLDFITSHLYEIWAHLSPVAHFVVIIGGILLACRFFLFIVLIGVIGFAILFLWFTGWIGFVIFCVSAPLVVRATKATIWEWNNNKPWDWNNPWE